MFHLPLDITTWPPENDIGNVEYKSTLLDITPSKIQKLITQMKWRLNEGADLCSIFNAIYVLGIYDNGKIANCDIIEINKTIDIIEYVTSKCDAHFTRMIYAMTNFGRIAILYITKNNNNNTVYNDDTYESLKLFGEL